MTRIIPYEKLERRYEDLAMAIVIQAADDYKRYVFVLDTIDLRQYKDEEGKNKALSIAKREVQQVESFFKSQWFYELTELNGEIAFKALQKTYRAEYYPVRMLELLDENKIGRFRHV